MTDESTNVFSELADDFVSNNEYDFRTVEGWQEFIEERLSGKTNRTEDGLQIRDFRFYAVGVASIWTTDKQPQKYKIKVRCQGALKLTPGMLYVYHPNESGEFIVSSFLLGPPDQAHECTIKMALKNPPSVDSFYYIALKADNIPGGKLAKSLSGKILNESLKQSKKIIRNGIKMMRLGGGAYYIIEAYSPTGEKIGVQSCPSEDNRCFEETPLTLEDIKKVNNLYEAWKVR